MVSDLISLLFKILNASAKRKENRLKLDHQYFDQFIQPTWEAFQQVHEDYKDSFRRYRQMLSTNQSKPEQIAYQIMLDSLDTANLRTALRLSAAHLPPHESEAKEKLLTDFAFAIGAYLSIPTDHFPKKKHRILPRLTERIRQIDTNVSRDMLAANLVQESHIGNRSALADTITSIVEDLQRKYQTVADTYFQMKTAFYSPNS